MLQLRALADALVVAAGDTDPGASLPRWIASADVERLGGPRRTLQARIAEHDGIAEINLLVERIRVDHFHSATGWFVRARHGHDVHHELRANPDRMREKLRFNYVQDLGHALLEAWDCSCGSTLSLAGIGPVMDDD